MRNVINIGERDSRGHQDRFHTVDMAGHVAVVTLHAIAVAPIDRAEDYWT